ncbi:tRNA (cytidine(34)-2'-O)-methyltransferase [Woodsholea maritima]|uniref:tRNA (cytidine(34)-2'-O)-methyltransferase n=1 Tax=Woodsholea maritima TaxID=240237 RepID=UPI00036F3F4E|nr:TrmH family RNA methyltransferase [Woodsholea maritima]
MRVAFFQPDIPQNVGAAMRLCACFGLALDIIEPCAFALSDKGIRKAAMDYQAHCTVNRHASFTAFFQHMTETKSRIVLMTTKGADPLWSFKFEENDCLLMGSESAGVPQDVHEAAHQRVVIPTAGGTRSLNIVTAAAIGLGHAASQGFTGAQMV